MKITAIYGSTYKDLERENKILEDLLHKANDEVISYTNCCIDLKEKIDKAIEYIKNCPEYLWANVNTKTLLEILGDKE